MDHRAIVDGDIEALQIQLDRGLKITEVDNVIFDIGSDTALYIAFLNRQLDSVKFLVSNGHPINIYSLCPVTFTMTPIFHGLFVGTLRRSTINILKYLCNHGVDINMQDSPNRHTCLHVIVNMYHPCGLLIELLSCLLELGADPLIPDRHGMTIIDSLRMRLYMKWYRSDEQEEKDNIRKMLDVVKNHINKKFTLFMFLLPILLKNK